MKNYSVMATAILIGISISFPAIAATGEKFREALSEGQRRLESATEALDYTRAKGFALDAVQSATTKEEKGKAAVLLEDTLKKLAVTENISSKEQLTLLLQSAGTYGLRGDFGAMENKMADAVKKVESIEIVSKIEAFWDASFFYMKSREYEVARVLKARWRELREAATAKNTYRCRFIQSAPIGVGGWLASDFIRNPDNRESGFHPYGEEYLLIAEEAPDVAAERGLEHAKKTIEENDARKPAFYMAYDTKGWHIFVRSYDPDVERVMMESHRPTDMFFWGRRPQTRLEMFFSPGLEGVSYYQWILGLATGDADMFHWDSPHRFYRYLEEKPGSFQVETAALEDGWGTAIFIPWRCLYDKLPFMDGNDDTWRFTIMSWGPQRLTWGGLVHETGRWGLVHWDPPSAAQRRAILQRLITRAWWDYRDTKGTLIEFWSCPRRGDPAFYEARIKPAVALHEAYGDKIETIGDWDDRKIETVFENLVPVWMEFDYEVEDMRASYLTQTLTAGRERTQESGVWGDAPFVCYIVPAISSIRRLPDTLPPDGVVDDRITLIGAKGEFIPASFVVAPRANVERFELQPSALRNVDNTRAQIPSEKVDIRVVKVWWQSGTGWCSYFADNTRRELVPELLLKDESLVTVDMENREQYLRVDYPEGPEQYWISYEYSRHIRHTRRGEIRFDYYKKPFEDSPELLPVKLDGGHNKQFWITVKIPAEADAGIYEGIISLTADGAPAGEITVRLRVLPFALPDPMTYYNLDRPFISSMYRLGQLRDHLREFDGDREMAETKARNLYENQRAHNIFNYYGPNIASWRRQNVAEVMEDEEQLEIFVRQLELIGEAGFKPPLFGTARADIGLDPSPTEESLQRYLEGVDKLLDTVESVLGHREVFFWGAGEPGKGTLGRQLEGWEALNRLGVRIAGEGKPRHFPISGFVEELVNYGGSYYDRSYTAPWRAVGHGVMNYAGHHTGPENPELTRRRHGMMLYKAKFDGTFNHCLHDTRRNWLEFWAPYGYRIGMVYPTQTDMIDTIAWEGFREGIDDIRYATKLKMLAEKAIATGDTDAVYAAKKALMWLELHDEKNADLNAMRIEMINYILDLIENMGKDVR